VYLLDTNILSEITRRQPNLPVVRRIFSYDRRLMFASEITRFELRLGAALRLNSAEQWARIEREILPRVNWLPIDGAVSVAAANLYAELQQAGQLIEVQDILIAATAQANQLTVVTRNMKHFSRLPNIEVENWFPAE
jgi:tRNA(fMet)-specific endonuclease VapC